VSDQPTEISPPPDTGRPPHRARRPMALLVLAGILVVAAIVVPLLVWTYAHDAPRLWGFPFFYWYQLMWVFIAAFLTYVAYLFVEGREK